MIGLPVPHAPAIDPQDPPRAQSLPGDLIREAVWIGRRGDRLGGKQPRRVMMSVTVPGRAVKARHHHERPVETDHADHVFQHGLPIPAPERLLDRLGVAVVNGGGEVEVVQAVVAPRENELACADQSKRVEELGSDRVGARLAAIQAEQRRAGAPPAACEGEHAGVLVVGVRGDVKHAGRGGELADPVPGAQRAPVRLQLLAGDGRREGQNAVECWRRLGGGGRGDGGEGNGRQVRAR